MMRYCILFAFVVSVAACAEPKEWSVDDYIAAIEGPQETVEEDLDALTLTELMDEFNVPGISVAVIRDFDIHWAKAYGVADIESGALADTETLFQAASISKPVAAMAVLKAVEDGKFSLDDDINTILKSWRLPDSEFTADQAVTPRSLTSHTSGLGDGFGFPGYHPSDPVPTLVQILNGEKPSNVGPVIMERPPLVAMKYSGGGVTLMQLAIEEATGEPFAALLQETVLGPIGMTQSTFEQPLPAAWDRNAARAHDENGNAMDTKWHVYPELAAAGLWTTPTELAKFAIEVQESLQGRSNRVLNQTSVREMLSPVGVGPYAIGFSIEKRGEGWYFAHGGSNWGFRALLMGHKIKGYGLVVMTNASEGGTLIQEIGKRVERAYRWDSLDGPVPR
ncbi:MAG: serine hydrolase [Gammaproteobacteria bacterium]|nr:serine hydrolase [Gammaproteobacteria bacterium]